MDAVYSGLFGLFGVLLGGLITILTARITANSQGRIAETNASKELELQNRKLADERLRSRLSFYQEKLEELHGLILEVDFEYSLTQSYMVREFELNKIEYMKRHDANVKRFFKAQLIADLYYPNMGHEIHKISQAIDSFWARQKDVLELDAREGTAWDQTNLALQKVIESSKVVEEKVKELRALIREKAKELQDYSKEF